MEPLARREVLRAAALVSCGIGAGGVGPQLAVAREVSPEVSRPPASGVLTAWVRLDLARGADIRLAQAEEPGGTLRDVALTHVPLADLTGHSVDQLAAVPVRQAALAAARFATVVAAQSWHVPAAECQVESGRIRHPLSGHVVGYVAWVDFA